MALVLKHATLQQLGEEFRERYRLSKGVESYRLASWLVARIQDGTFTQAQVRNFFNLSQAQWDVLRTKWEDWKAKYDEMRTAEGNGDSG
jgi:hypothetical protein